MRAKETIQCELDDIIIRIEHAERELNEIPVHRVNTRRSMKNYLIYLNGKKSGIAFALGII